MAADCAAAFEKDIGPARVLGISLGGYIAQHLGADFPQHVRRLVIACAAHRVSEAGRAIPQRWLTLAREQRWREFYFDVAKVTLQEYQQTFYQFLIPFLRKRPADPHDFLVSLEACLAHDGTELLHRIRAPTLVIGGTNDIFFPEALFREATQRIPHAKLLLMEGTGHGAYELQKSQFERAVMDFLRGQA
jgi:pimeloyl-ACP methyl ester carboxylesterase